MLIYLCFMKNANHGIDELVCVDARETLPPPGTGDRDDFIWTDFGIDEEDAEIAFDKFCIGHDGTGPQARWKINGTGDGLEKVDNTTGRNLVKTRLELMRDGAIAHGQQPDPRVLRAIGYINQENSLVARAISYIRNVINGS